MVFFLQKDQQQHASLFCTFRFSRKGGKGKIKNY